MILNVIQFHAFLFFSSDNVRVLSSAARLQWNPEDEKERALPLVLHLLLCTTHIEFPESDVSRKGVQVKLYERIESGAVHFRFRRGRSAMSSGFQAFPPKVRAACRAVSKDSRHSGQPGPQSALPSLAQGPKITRTRRRRTVRCSNAAEDAQAREAPRTGGHAFIVRYSRAEQLQIPHANSLTAMEKETCQPDLP